MTNPTSDDFARREEAKRDANWSPAERWQVLQETITWAEAQLKVPRNTPARCLELQVKKLASAIADAGEKRSQAASP
jgi:hypothetical protein